MLGGTDSEQADSDTGTISTTTDSDADTRPTIYEPFDYPVGPLNLQSGSSEIGLTGKWAALSTEGKAMVVAKSLTYGTLPVSGGSIGNLTFYSNRYGGARPISPSALAGSGLLADGATVWFSLEMGHGHDADGTPADLTNARLAFALANSSFNQGTNEYWINDEYNQVGSGLGVTLGCIGDIEGRVVATQFPDGKFGDGFDGNVLGNFMGLPLGAEQHALIVGKVLWGAVTDTIEVYQPDTNLNLGSPISTLTVSVDQSTYDTITFTRSDPITMDEIRFGSSYRAVIGAP